MGLMRSRGGFVGPVVEESPETCLWCGEPVHIIVMRGTGFCCTRHREAAEALATQGDPDTEEGM